MGVAEINLLHETMQSIKITNTLKKTKKKEVETTTTGPKNIAWLRAALCRCLWEAKKKKKNSLFPLPEKIAM